MTLTPHQKKLLEAAETIRKDADDTELAFMARQLVQATLPHRNPGDVPIWTRENGNLTLSVQPGINLKTRKSYGYPYGTIPRLLLFWLTTEVVKTKKRRIDLGHSLNAFMLELGLNPDNGSIGAKRSDAKRLKEQMERLFFSRISFQRTNANGDAEGQAWMHMEVAPKGEMWWDFKNPDSSSLFESWIMLGEDFYESLLSAPVPMDMRVLKVLKQSPLALDLYAWVNHTSYIAKQHDKIRNVSWELLQQQFGGDYTDVREFARKAKAAFKKIQDLCPSLYLEYVRGGVEVAPAHIITVEARKLRPEPSSSHANETTAGTVSPKTMPKLSAKTIEDAKAILLKAGTGWDVYSLEQEFYIFAAKKGIPANVHTAFLGFVRKKSLKNP